jgi:NADPH:quinone reductase-like Zn-dependent oxidoreductase
MKAIICTAYGPPDVLKLQEVEKPRPKDQQALIRIYATTVSRADCELRRFDFPGWVWLPIRL